MIRLVLVDDHPIILDGLAHLFAGHTDLAVVARCVDGQEALDAVRKHQPDILVLDLRLPVLDGLSVLRAIREERLPVQTLVLTAAIDDDDVVDAIRLGARGLVLKESAPTDLIRCIRQVHAGGQSIPERYLSRTLDALVRREAGLKDMRSSLTPREIDIVRLVALGRRNKGIARELGITEGTVKIHLHNIYRKLQVTSRVALTLMAQDKGLA